MSWQGEGDNCDWDEEFGRVYIIFEIRCNVFEGHTTCVAWEVSELALCVEQQ